MTEKDVVLLPKDKPNTYVTIDNQLTWNKQYFVVNFFI